MSNGSKPLLKFCVVWLWLAIAEGDAMSAPLDSSARDSAVITEPQLTNILADRFAGQQINNFDIDAPIQERKSIFKGSFDLETSLKWNPTVKVLYRIPMTVEKRPTANASHIVLYCSWVGGARPQRPPKYGEPTKQNPLYDEMKPFSDDLDFTGFSLEIVTDQGEMENRREAYFYAGPEWVDVVLRAREEIIRRHHLEKRKLLIYGPCVGGVFAERLAVAMPAMVCAVAIQNAPQVSLPALRANTAWFVGVTRGDAGRTANLELVETLRKLGTPCLHVTTPPASSGGAVDYHSVSPEARRAAGLFLQGVAKLEDSGGESDPARWPYVRDQAQPLTILLNDQQTVSHIPLERREYLPSQEFGRALQNMAVPAQAVTLGPINSRGTSCMVGVPPVGTPKGIIIYSHDYNFPDLARFMENINFLSAQGYLVLAPRLKGNSEVAIQTTLDFVLKSKLLANLPRSFIAVGSGNDPLWKILLTQRNIKPTMYVPIDFEPGQLMDQAKWPEGARIDWPVVFLYGQKNFKGPETPNEASRPVAEIESVNNFVDGQQRRNQVAAVTYVPGTIRFKEQMAQKSIEAAVQIIDSAIAGKISIPFK